MDPIYRREIVRTYQMNYGSVKYDLIKI